MSSQRNQNFSEACPPICVSCQFSTRAECADVPGPYNGSFCWQFASSFGFRNKFVGSILEYMYGLLFSIHVLSMNVLPPSLLPHRTFLNMVIHPWCNISRVCRDIWQASLDFAS